MFDFCSTKENTNKKQRFLIDKEEKNMKYENIVNAIEWCMWNKKGITFKLHIKSVPNIEMQHVKKVYINVYKCLFVCLCVK